MFCKRDEIIFLLEFCHQILKEKSEPNRLKTERTRCLQAAQTAMWGRLNDLRQKTTQRLSSVSANITQLTRDVVNDLARPVDGEEDEDGVRSCSCSMPHTVKQEPQQQPHADDFKSQPPKQATSGVGVASLPPSTDSLVPLHAMASPTAAVSVGASPVPSTSLMASSDSAFESSLPHNGGSLLSHSHSHSAAGSNANHSSDSLPIEYHPFSANTSIEAQAQGNATRLTAELASARRSLALAEQQNATISLEYRRLLQDKEASVVHFV